MDIFKYYIINSLKCLPFGFKTLKNLVLQQWKCKNVRMQESTRMIPTGQFPLGKLVPKKIPNQDNSHLNNSHPENSHQE